MTFVKTQKSNSKDEIIIIEEAEQTFHVRSSVRFSSRRGGVNVPTESESNRSSSSNEEGESQGSKKNMSDMLVQVVGCVRYLYLSVCLPQ